MWIFENTRIKHGIALFVSTCLIVPLFLAAGLPSPLNGTLLGVALYVFAVWGMADALLMLLGVLGRLASKPKPTS